jgi:hypothetical protein
MGTKPAALTRRVEVIEAQLQDRSKAPPRALPEIVDQLDSPEAARLRVQGYAVMTFEQCAEAMV